MNKIGILKENAAKIMKHNQDHGLQSFSSAILSFMLQKIDRKFFLRNLTVRENLDSYGSESLNTWALAEEDDVIIPDCSRMPIEFEFVTGEYLTDRRRICEIDNCSILGERAVIFDSDENIILEASGRNIERFLSRRQFLFGDEYFPTVARLAAGRNTPKSRDLKRLFPLVSIYRQGYYFWLLEYLPKLRALEHYIEKEGTRPKILLQPDPPSYMTESLAVAGYDSNDVLEWDRTPTRVDSLILTQHRMRKFSGRGPEGFNYNPSVRDIKWVREKFTKEIDDSDGDYSDRIYISRQEATRERYITNYEELMDLLSDKGFQSFCLENHSFEEQVKICSNAKVIIGPHGAGLTNMIFGSNVIIVEIFNQKFLKSPYYLLSKECGHEYKHYTGETEGDVNIRVDIKDFEIILNGII